MKRTNADGEIKQCRSAGVALAGRSLSIKACLCHITGKEQGRCGRENACDFPRAYAATLPDAENEIRAGQTSSRLGTQRQSALRRQPSGLGDGRTAAHLEVSTLTQVLKPSRQLMTLSAGHHRIHTPRCRRKEAASQRDSELRSQGQAVPSSTAGRQLFVLFRAPNETAAAKWIDRVKWEQSIQGSARTLALARAQSRYARSGQPFLGIAKR